MIIGVDHILIAVENVEQASEQYKRLGFEVQPGGEHPRMGTYNALVPLSDGSYLELIGVRDRSKAEQFPNTKAVAEALGRQNRLAAFALDTNDLATDVQALRWRGLAIGSPVEGERVRPDGQKVSWKTAHFDDPILPFLIQDITPHHIRVPLPASGLGAHAYLEQVLVGVRSLADASRVWKNLLGKIPSDDDQFELERARIRLVTAGGQSQGINAVAIAVDELERRVQELRERGVEVRQEQGRIELGPAGTAGARVILTAANKV